MIEYHTGRFQNDFLRWINRQMSLPSLEIQCEDLIEQIEILTIQVTLNQFRLVFFGDVNSKEYLEVILDLTQNYPVFQKFQFFHNSDPECAKHWGAKSYPALIAFRKFDVTPYIFEGTWDSDSVDKFLDSALQPEILEF